jgi:hypothetical protein
MGNLPSTRRSNPRMNNIDERKRFHYTFRENCPARFVRRWGVPGRGFTNGSKLMIRAVRTGPKVDHEPRNDCRSELAPESSSWSAPFVSGSSKLSTRRKEPWRSNGSFSDWQSGRCRRSGRSIGSLSAKVFWLNRLITAAPPLIQPCNPLSPTWSIKWTWWVRAISKAKNVSTE